MTSLMGVLVIVLLFGCASGPVATPEDLTPPVATPADAGTAASSGMATATPTLMDIVAADTRHFKGDPSAPVTIVEFGDFQ